MTRTHFTALVDELVNHAAAYRAPRENWPAYEKRLMDLRAQVIKAWNCVNLVTFKDRDRARINKQG